MSLLFPASQHRFTRNGVTVITGSNIFDLKETLPWWNITQGGFYSSENVLMGLCVGSFPSHAEYLDDRNIVTRLSKQDGNAGSAFDTRLRIAQDALSSRRQVGVIIHKNHNQLGVNGAQLPNGETHALAGYWVVTDIWIDWDGDTKYLMARLEKVTTDGVWWGPATPVANSGLGTISQTMNVCPRCQTAVPVRYIEGFFCGTADCPDSLNNRSTALLGNTRTYRADYFAHRSSMASVPAAPTLYLPPNPRQWTSTEYIQLYNDGKGPENLGWEGFYCHPCAVLNQKLHFDRLVCRKCGRSQQVTVPPLTFEDLVDPKWLDLQDNSEIPEIVLRHGAVEVLPHVIHPRFVVRRWHLGLQNCVVWLILPKKDAIYEPGGFKDLFTRFFHLTRTGAYELRRFQTESRIPGQSTNWFGKNIGIEYLSRMQMGTTSFAAAHPIITEFRNKIAAVVTDVTGTTPQFNELLSIGDIGKMGMSWHSDGEGDVIGEHIASTSLGGPGLMSFRLNNSFWKGRVTGNFDTDVPIIAGCYKEDEKRALQNAANAGTITTAEHRARLATLINGARGDPPHILDFPLPGTGAIMIQEGHDLGNFYHHSVYGKGMVRLVNTGRYLIDPSQQPGDKRKLDTDNGPKPKRAKRDQTSEDKDSFKPRARRTFHDRNSSAMDIDG